MFHISSVKIQKLDLNASLINFLFSVIAYLNN